MDKQEFNISLSDLTLIEGNGLFNKVSKIMKEDNMLSEKWMIRSQATLSHPYGSCELVLHFWHNKEVYIVDYMPSVKDFFGNQDLTYLSSWVQSKGWNLPKVSDELSIEKTKYWKYFWSVHLVDSDYLTKEFGDRENITIDLEHQRD